SRGGYYKWCQHTPSERSKRRERFERLVMCTFAQYRARNGKGFKYSKDVAAMTNVADNLLRRDFESETPNQK
ncbi:hypothetical protein VB549_24770, partial [Vibrio parahaemolyticus]|nr:hypothetical protein [Vibrio parahaemolyticus]